MVAWDFSRHIKPGYLVQSWVHYGGIALRESGDLGERFVQWCDLLRYFTASPVLNVVLLCGLPLLLIYDFRVAGRLEKWADVSLLGFAALFMGVHWLLSCMPWDRYLLGLVPLVFLLLARILRLLCAKLPPYTQTGLPFLLIVLLLWTPSWQAAQIGYPLGSDHWGYWGSEQVAGYIRQNLPPGAIIYHRRMHNHFLFLLKYVFHTSIFAVSVSKVFF